MLIQCALPEQVFVNAISCGGIAGSVRQAHSYYMPAAFMSIHSIVGFAINCEGRGLKLGSLPAHEKALPYRAGRQIAVVYLQ